MLLECEQYLYHPLYAFMVCYRMEFITFMYASK
jgi:hypothetical protein